MTHIPQVTVRRLHTWTMAVLFLVTDEEAERLATDACFVVRGSRESIVEIHGPVCRGCLESWGEAPDRRYCAAG